jgi:hypothetical protein
MEAPKIKITMTGTYTPPPKADDKPKINKPVELNKEKQNGK